MPSLAQKRQQVALCKARMKGAANLSNYQTCSNTSQFSNSITINAQEAENNLMKTINIRDINKNLIIN